MRIATMFLLLLVSALHAGSVIDHTFQAGQYPEWRKTGAALRLEQRKDGLLLRTDDTVWARLVRWMTPVPGRTYRIQLEGSGSVDMLYRKHHSNRYSFCVRDIFSRGNVFEYEFTLPADDPTRGRLMLRPSAAGQPVLLRRFTMTLLGPDPAELPLPDGESLEKNAPVRGRGFCFPDGRLTDVRAALLAKQHANLAAVRAHSAEEAEEFCRIAGRHGLHLALEFPQGLPERADGLLKQYARTLFSVQTGEPLSADSLKKLRQKHPRIRFAVPLRECVPAELLNDPLLVYTIRLTDSKTLYRIRALRVLHPVSVLAEAPADMSNGLEAAQLNYTLLTDDAALSADAEKAERELVKNATLEEQERSLIRAVRRARRPGALVFGFITDTHYASRPEFPGRKYPQPDWAFMAALPQMERFSRMAEAVNADFICNAGDIINGTLPKPELLRDLETAVRALSPAGIPALLLKGNHDDGTAWCFRYDRGLKRNALSEADWFRQVTLPCLKNGAVGDSAHPAANYFYRDFPASKIRVICLNISENPLTADSRGVLQMDSLGLFDISIHQLRFLAEKALNFSDKKDAAQWGVVLISHCELEKDSMPNAPLVNGVLEAFLRGGKFSGSTQKSPLGFYPGSIDCDFSRQGPGRIYASLYGHMHNQTRYVDYLYSTKFPVLGFPQALAEINPGMPPRPQGTPDENCFSFLVLDPAAGILKRFRLGAGQDDSFRLSP